MKNSESKGNLSGLREKARAFFRQNPGAPFIILFQLLLLVCAVLSIGGYSNSADEVAVYAYNFLVVGVVLQLVSFLQHGEEAEETEV
jgi:hypothetical protein